MGVYRLYHMMPSGGLDCRLAIPFYWIPFQSCVVSNVYLCMFFLMSCDEFNYAA